MMVLQEVMPCRMVDMCQHFGGTCCLPLPTQCHTIEDCNCNVHHNNNFKPIILITTARTSNYQCLLFSIFLCIFQVGDVECGRKKLCWYLGPCFFYSIFNCYGHLWLCIDIQMYIVFGSLLKWCSGHMDNYYVIMVVFHNSIFMD